MPTEDTHVGEVFKLLDTQRTIKKQKAREFAAATIPSIYPDDSLSLTYTPETEQEYEYPHTSVPARGVTGLAAKVTSGIMPMTNQPLVDISLRPSDMASIADNPELKARYAEASKLVQDEVYHVLSRSNLRPALFMEMKRLIVLGDNMIRQRDGYEFEVHRFDTYVVKRDMQGNPYYAILRQYATEMEIPEDIRKTVMDNAHDVVTRTDGDRYPLYTKMKRDENGDWTTSQWFSDVMVPDSEKEYKKGNFPYFFSRWNWDPYDNYGISLVEENYGDIVAASAIRQALMEGYSIATTGFIGVAPGSLTVNMVKEATPWQPLPVDDPNALTFIQPQNIAALTSAEQMDIRLTTEIRRIFHMDVSAELTHERTTATQVMMAKEELNTATGGLLSTYDRTTLRPIIINTIHNLVNEGVFSEEITKMIDSDDITIDVKSGIEAQGRESEYRNVMNFVAEVSQVIPNGVDMFDLPALIRWAGKTKGAPEEIFKSDEQRDAEQQAALQQQAAQGLVEQIPQAANTVLTEQLRQGN